MTDSQFRLCWQEAEKYNEAEAYVSGLALSSMWGEAPDDEIPAARLQQLACIWQAAHTSIRAIRQAAGLTQAAFGERFLIPRRTIEEWEAGRRTPPDYTRLLLMQAVGMFTPADFGTAR